MGKKTIGAGFKGIWYGVNDASGEFIGGTTTAPANGNQDGAGMVRLDGARVIPINIPELSIETVIGDDEPEVTFDWDSDSLTQGVLELSQSNNVFDALIQGTSIYTDGDIEWGVLDPQGRISQSICFLIQRRAKSWLAGTKGNPEWEIFFLKQVIAKALGVSAEMRSHTPYRYSYSTSKADLGLGFSINETYFNTTSAPVLHATSPNPIYYECFRGDGAETVFNLTYPIITAAKTYVYVNHIRQTVTTNYTAAGSTLTFVAPPADSAVIEVIPEVLESNLF